jgi:hypothetical protein
MKKIFISFLFIFLLVSFSFASINRGVWKKRLPININLSNNVDYWSNLPAKSTSTILNVSISTTALVSATTTYTLANSDINDIVFPRNINIDTYFATGEVDTTVSGDLTITGNDQFGRVQIDSISVSTNTAISEKIWSSIQSLEFSDFSISGAVEANVVLSAGIDNKIALSNNIENTNNIIKVIEDGVVETNAIIDIVNDSITFNSVLDGIKDYYVYYTNRTNKYRYNS